MPKNNTELELEILEAIRKIIAAKGDFSASYDVANVTVKESPFSKSVKEIININIKLEKAI